MILPFGLNTPTKQEKKGIVRNNEIVYKIHTVSLTVTGYYVQMVIKNLISPIENIFTANIFSLH